MIRLLTFIMIAILVGQYDLHGDDSRNHSLLWKVRSKANATSYVFGTIHIPDSLVLFQRDTTLVLLRQSRVFYAEIDVDSMLTGIDPSTFLLPAGTTIESLYSDDDLALIRKALTKAVGPSAQFMETMRPGALVTILSLSEVQSTADYGVDEFLWRYARSVGVPRKGIEYISEQTKVISDMPKEVLVELVKSMDTLNTDLVKLRGAYIQENLDSLELIGEELEDYPDFSKSLNSDRNKTIIKRLKSEFTKGGVFLALGALHLPGTKGVLQLLRNEGFRVEPVFGSERSNWMHRQLDSK